VYRNGQIPASALAHPASAPRAMFRPDAAAAFDRMSAGYRALFGRDLAVTDSYRSYAAQVSVRERKPGLAARPGTSNHGLGLAADLGGGVERFGTPEHEWVAQNGPRFGWSFPGWAQRGGSRPEPWHAEWSPVGSST
jgi:D-alanyl-D-alanine carboxypeptidase